MRDWLEAFSVSKTAWWKVSVGAVGFPVIIKISDWLAGGFQLSPPMHQVAVFFQEKIIIAGIILALVWLWFWLASAASDVHEML